MRDDQLLEQIRRLNGAFLRPDQQAPTMAAGIKAISEETGSSALVMDESGLLLSSFPDKDKLDQSLERLTEKETVQKTPGLMKLLEGRKSTFNEPCPAELEGEKKEPAGKNKEALCSVVPITGGGRRLATLLLYHPSGKLDFGHQVLAEIGGALVGMVLLQATADQEDQEARNRELAEGAFESLSYSEVEAIREILKNIKNNESVVIASKIADSLGITRSVIVNALRKFESAGIIESRSLGMKGTFIRVKNKHALEIVASRSAKLSHIR
jgi:transcriptional pleiotropic repressor